MPLQLFPQTLFIPTSHQLKEVEESPPLSPSTRKRNLSLDPVCLTDRRLGLYVNDEQEWRDAQIYLLARGRRQAWANIFEPPCVNLYTSNNSPPLPDSPPSSPFPGDVICN